MSLAALLAPSAMPVPLPLGQAAVPRDTGVFEFLLDPQRWTGSPGILGDLLDTVLLCAGVIAFAVVLAVPLAAYLAHERKAELVSAWVVNIGRAIPTFAIAGLLVPVSLRAGLGFEPWPIFIALTLLSVPPMFLSTYVAVRQVPSGVVDAARAVGYAERDVLTKVELPLALTVIFTGIRVAAVQVVATEPIRAFLGGDGLGRYVRDGLGQRNDDLVIVGAMLIALLAGATGLLFTGVERLVKPVGVRRLGRPRVGRLLAADDAESNAKPANPAARDRPSGPGASAATERT